MIPQEENLYQTCYDGSCVRCVGNVNSSVFRIGSQFSLHIHKLPDIVTPTFNFSTEETKEVDLSEFSVSLVYKLRYR